MSLDVLDWRRRTHALYARVRAAPDPRTGHRIWRRDRDHLLTSHPASALPPGWRTRYAPYDPRLRFDATVAPAEPLRVEIPTATDGVVPFDRIGRVTLPGVGTLDVWWLGSYGGGLFLPMRDGTSGDTTYGGGRYLLDTVKGADLGGAIVVDLNFAYNPSCAYDPRWACPLPTAGNTLTAEVHAGELTPVPPN